MKNNFDQLSRRTLMQNGAGCVMGSTAVLNTLLNLNLANSAVAASSSSNDDYKALVCVFLFGGNDSFNMLIPTSEGEYEKYQETRGSLALPKEGEGSALPLKRSPNLDRDFALHPSMPEIRNLYHKGDLAFISNVGTLIEPVTIEQYRKKSVRLPKSLFSHNDQRDQWQTSLPQIRGADGWLGRAADLMQDMAKTGGISMNVSLSGNNLLQTGKSAVAYNITPQGSVSLTNPLAKGMFQASAATDPQQNLFAKVFADSTRSSIEMDRKFSEAFDGVSIKTEFPSGPKQLASSLQSIARTIGARSSLGLKRQTFFVMMGGFDNHQDLLEDHPTLLREVSQSLGAFQSALNELEVADAVTTFTASDFGRTLRSNGRGTDHAWGGNVMAMGGAVNGGQIYGRYPEALILKDGLDVGTNGRILPTTSCDAYFCELLKWFGVAPGDMETVLPNVGNFLDPTSPGMPLGFLKPPLVA